MELSEFLLARIAGDEQIAQAATAWSDEWFRAQDGVLERVGFVGDGPDRHIVRWDPARVLAECEAKRRIVEDHGDQHDCTSLNAGDWPYVGCRTLRLLTLPYADHSDYRLEWRP